MGDGTVGLRQSVAPDRLVDNETLTIGGLTVYRQRVADPTAHTKLDSLLSVLADVKRSVTDYETRLSYAGTSTDPEFVGKALNGTATSATTWTVQKLTYDASNRLVRVQVLTGAWDNRATLAW